MTVDFAHTRAAQESREAKADQLAAFMAHVRLTRQPSTAAERRALEQGAEINRASDETWARAIELWQWKQRR